MPTRSMMRQYAPWALLAAAPAAVFLVLRTNAALDFEVRSPEGHFYIVSVVASINVALGLIAVFAALRTRSVRVLLLAMAFVSMAGIFAVHGLSTPGFLVGEQYWAVTALSSRLSAVVASSLLAASAIDLPRPIDRQLLRLRVPILVGWVAAIVAYGFVGLRFPEQIPQGLMTSRPLLDVSFVAVLLLAGFTAHRYFYGYRRSGLPMYGAVTLGALLIMQAQVGVHFGMTYHGTFWLYHIQLLIGFSAILWGLFIEYARGRSPVLAMEGLTLRDPIEQIQAGYTESIRSLAAALEAKDGYTLGHGERVASLSVLMGEVMGLSPERLRPLYQGALLHDVGKIGVPDMILHKPGRLTDDEFAVIKDHPVRGEAMLSAAVGNAGELGVILHHHERFDGDGYPHGLEGGAIPIEARIAAVADVYDALRSSRAYRPAWTRDEAHEHVLASSGSHFDPDVVEAFTQVVDHWETTFAADGAPYVAFRPAA